MLNFGTFETEMQLRYPTDSLVIRNMCDGGDTPGFRPHSGRVSPWAFPGAEKFQTELAQNSGSEGVFETPDEWLSRLQADIILGFFGYNESFEGPQGLENYKEELDAFIKHSLKQKYNGTTPPQLIIVSPIAFEDLSDHIDVPNGETANQNLKLYSEAMKEVCLANNIPFINVFQASKNWYDTDNNDLTIDGSQLNKEGYEKFAQFLADELTGNKSIKSEGKRLAVNEAIKEKNFYWHNDYKIPNGVHVFGRRHAPYGPDNYPYGIKKTRELTAIRDSMIWATVQNQSYDVASADALTSKLPPVKTNYNLGNKESILQYKYGDEAHRVRPTSGMEFISSSHFPDEVQGDMLLANSIGFLGLKQHQMMEDGTGYTSKHRQDLITSNDPNFRPVEMEFAPDSSLYIVDWHNVLIGHMQHNARDPLRDHVHGRIYRITYPSRPLVKPAKIDGASIDQLFENLRLPEYRTRYRTRRELRGRDVDEVLTALKTWVSNLDTSDSNYDHNRLEALWVSWGMNKVDANLLEALLKSDDHKVRAAAVRVVRYMGHQLNNAVDLLKVASSDTHGRVRLEAITAASWLPKSQGMEILEVARKHPLDEWMQDSFNFAETRLTGNFSEKADEKILASHLKGTELEIFAKGKKIYETEGYCITCHQEGGTGLQKAGYPTLVGQEWVLGDEERLIKLALHGLYGPMNIMGNHYEGQVPMMAFKGLLKDDEIAAVLTYARNAFGNKASVISSEQVKQVREATKDRNSFYTPEELLKEHPMN